MTDKGDPQPLRTNDAKGEDAAAAAAAAAAAKSTKANRSGSTTVTVTDTTARSTVGPLVAGTANAQSSTAATTEGSEDGVQFPATPLRFFCEGYTRVQQKRKDFAESLQRQREQAVAQRSASASVLPRPSPRLAASAHPSPSRQSESPLGAAASPKPSFGGPPSFLSAMAHLIFIGLIVYVVFSCMQLV